MSDRILVRDLRLWAHVGVLEQERQLGQWFGLDLSFDVDLAVAGASDRLDDTLDYAGAVTACLLYTSPSPRDRQKSRMPSSA